MSADSFVFYRSFIDAIKEQPPETVKNILVAVCDYALDDKDVDLSGVEKMALELIKPFLNKTDAFQKHIGGGSIHWNWKGGVTSENHRIRESAEYKDWIKKVFSRDEYTCRRCGQLGGKLNAHHIESFSEHPELRFEVSNGLTLCEKCHKKAHKEQREDRNGK